MTILFLFLLVAGLFFLLVSSIGIIRLPDFYTRAHAAGKSETLGAILVLLALVTATGFGLDSFKLLLIVVLVAITNPTGIHAVSRAALRSGRELWVRGDRIRADERARIQAGGARRRKPGEETG